MYVHWTEKMGLDGMLFPNWKKALLPDDKSIAGHLWLLMVKHCYDTLGWQLQKAQSILDQEPSTSSNTILIPPTSSVSNVRQTPVRQTPCMASHKGKEQAISEEMEAMSMDHGGDQHLYNKGKSEVSDKVVEVDEEVAKTVYGQFKKQVRPELVSQTSMSRQHLQSWMGQRARNDPESEAEGHLHLQFRCHINWMMPSWIIPQHHPTEKDPANLSLPKLCWGQDSKSDLPSTNDWMQSSTDKIKCSDGSTIWRGSEATVAGQDTQPMTSITVEESGTAIEVTEEQRDTIMEECGLGQPQYPWQSSHYSRINMAGWAMGIWNS
ncbi:hypothetical protein EDC04DRAFT_2613385 [Pisolithus marmoratus]|nr:hypothetical protein EDC04DRAFT_2613385 [Pisolithus marmoratus]